MEAKNASNPNSSYLPLLNKFQFNYYPAMQNAPGPENVAKMILQAITDENRKLQYYVGEDVNMLRKKMSDSEFHNLMQHTVLH